MQRIRIPWSKVHVALCRYFAKLCFVDQYEILLPMALQFRQLLAKQMIP